MDAASFFQELFTPTGFIKMLILIIIVILTVFTLVVCNQVRVMNNVVTEKHSSGILMGIAILNILCAISLFFYSIAIL